jgi:hypothetical protein
MRLEILTLRFGPLDRDPSRWGVDPKETLRRRELFWELYTYDSWQVRHLLAMWARLIAYERPALTVSYIWSAGGVFHGPY